MTRLDPKQIKERAAEAAKEKRKLEAEKRLSAKAEKPKRIAFASKAEKDSIWSIFVTAALNGVDTAYFDRLNSKEQNFIQSLGLTAKQSEEFSLSPYKDLQVRSLKSEITYIDTKINTLEREDPLSDEIRILSARRGEIFGEIFSLQSSESLYGKIPENKVKKTTYEVDLVEDTEGAPINEEYDLSWLYWLLNEGQTFFSKIERKITKSADAGESYEIFIGYESTTHATSFTRSQEREAMSAYKTPWTSYDYFVDEKSIAELGPEPEILKYFLELLGYQCTLRRKNDEAVIRVKWR